MRMPEKIVAIRLKSIYHGKAGFGQQGAEVINAGLEKRDPALRNINEALLDHGLVYDIGGCGLYWFLIDDRRAVDYYHGLNEVEIAFDVDWFEAQKARIRGYSGVRYYDACAAIARAFSLKDQQRSISYTLPERKVA